MHDNQLGGDADEIERLLNEQKQKQKEASGDAPIEPGPDWTPGVSIHPLELRFEETASCETRDVVVTVFNTDARETLSVLSVTTDLQSFQPKAIANEPDVVEPGGSTKFAVTFAPRGAGKNEGTLMVITDKGSFLIKARGGAVESPYGLQPLSHVKVPPRFPHVFALEVHNPHDTNLRVVEAVSSDQFVQLAAAPSAGEERDDVFFKRDESTGAQPSGESDPRRRDVSKTSSGRRVRERRASRLSASLSGSRVGGGGSRYDELEGLRGELLNASTLFVPTIDTSGVLFSDDDETFDASWSDDARVAVAFANQKLEEEDKRYRAKVGRLPPLPRRSDDAWVVRPGETKTVLLARLAINRVGMFEGSVRLTMRYEVESERLVMPTGAYGERTAASFDVARQQKELATKTVNARIPISATCASGVTVSPSRLDFGVAARRSDRLRATLSLFNGASRSTKVTQIETRPNDPSLRARLENGFADGVLPAFTNARDAIALTYSGKLEGFRTGLLLVHTDSGDPPLEVSYRARVVHGKLEFDVDEASFASPDVGRAPFQKQRKTFSVTNGFPVPLAVFGARVVVDEAFSDLSGGEEVSSTKEKEKEKKDAACCLRVVSSSFDATQVVRPGEAVRSLEIEYEPRAVAALFDARLELDTNLTTLQVPLRVYHGQLACFDAAQAATRAAAAAAAASSAYSTVTPARPSPEAGELTDERATGANSSELSLAEIAVPCAVSDGKYREKEGLSIMGVIDFGVTRVGDTKVRRVAVRNPNPVAVAIESVTSTVRAARVTRVEVSAAPLSAPIAPSSVSALQSEFATRNTPPFRPDPPPEGCLTERGKMAACVQSFARRELLSETSANGADAGDILDDVLDAKKLVSSAVVIPPDHVATIDVLAAPEEEEMARMGGMLSFTLDNGRVLVAPVVLRALRGEVAVAADGNGRARVVKKVAGGDVTEALATLEVPAAFPGRSTRASLTLQSSFAEAVTVFGFASSDPAVRLELSEKKLKPGKRVVVGEVVFDPAAMDADRAYTGLARNKRAGATKDKRLPAQASSQLSPRETGSAARDGAKRGFWRRSVETVRGFAASFFGFGADSARRFAPQKRHPDGARAVPAAPALSSADVEEITRARDAWARVAGGDDPHAASSATVESILTVRTDAVDEVRVRVRTKLIRPKMLLFSGDDDDEFAKLDIEAFVDDEDEDEDEDGAGDDAKKSPVFGSPSGPDLDLSETSGRESRSGTGTGPANVPAATTPASGVSEASKSNSPEKARTARSARVVDFGSAQVGAKTRRRRVVFINPFADQSLCVRVLPMVPAATTTRGRDVRVAGGSGALDDILEAAEAHFLGEYPAHSGFFLEGGELASARRGVKAGGGFQSGRSDWTCLSPYSKIDLGALVFAPREVRPYAAHLCVRNNFTTLECATLRGDGDAVKVSVSKTKRTKKQFGNIVKERESYLQGLLESSSRAPSRKKRLASPPAVTDVAFRLPRVVGAGAGDGDGDGASSVDVLTRAIWVVNDGSAVARVGKPWIGAVECGGDGSVGGYTVSPCGAFELPPGASKRLTVVCHPEHARKSVNAPNTWTQLAMDVKSADGESARLVVQLSASARVAGGAYAAGELERRRAFGFFSFLFLSLGFWSRALGTTVALGVVAFGAKRYFVFVRDEKAYAKEKEKNPRDDKGREERSREKEKRTLAQRRREKALEGDGDAKKNGAAPLSLSALRTGDAQPLGSPLSGDRAESASPSPDSVMHPARARGPKGASGGDSEASPSSTPPSPPLSPPADSRGAAATATATATATAARRESALLGSQGARPEASPPQSPVPSPKAGRRHAKEIKPPTLTLSSIPKPKSPTAGSASSADGSAPGSPAFDARTNASGSSAPPAEKKSASSPREASSLFAASVSRARAAPSPSLPPRAPFASTIAGSPTPSKSAMNASTSSSPGNGTAPSALVSRGDAPRAPPAPPPFSGGAEASRVSDGSARPPSLAASGARGAFVERSASFARPAPPRRTADGGWLAPPLPPREPPPSNQPRREAGDDASLNSSLVELRREIHTANANQSPLGFEPGTAAAGSALGSALASRPNAFENRLGSGTVSGGVGGGWMPSPPAPAVPAFAPPSNRLGLGGAANAFGGGNSLGLNLLSGGALGYNMWGAPAPPPGGATGAPRSAGGSFVGSFFDGGGDDPLEPPAGPGPGRIDVGGNLDGSLNAKTQESSELDAETEWSKHNKGLLDDLGLD